LLARPNASLLVLKDFQHNKLEKTNWPILGILQKQWCAIHFSEEKTAGLVMLLDGP
jgi:hypothetical protein